MSIHGIHGIQSAVSPAGSETANARGTTATAAASINGSTSTGTDGAIKNEEADNKPQTVHFPWLSRLSQQLEAASNKRQTFPTQILGDNLDQRA